MASLPEPPGRHQSIPTPPNQYLLSESTMEKQQSQAPRQTRNQNSPAPRQSRSFRSSALPSQGFSRPLSYDKEPVLPRPRRNHPVVWCSAIMCFLFSLLLIFFGIATLIIFVIIKPKHPVFDIPTAKLGAIYFNSPQSFNGDLTFLANFSNPNKKLAVKFETAKIKLFFTDRLIAAQALQSFTLRHGEIKSGAVHMVSSLVYLPPQLALELKQKVQSNKVEYNITGDFKVKAMMGSLHFSYSLHSRCLLQMTGPPIGGLVGSNCSRNK